MADRLCLRNLLCHLPLSRFFGQRHPPSTLLRILNIKPHFTIILSDITLTLLS